MKKDETGTGSIKGYRHSRHRGHLACDLAQSESAGAVRRLFQHHYGNGLSRRLSCGVSNVSMNTIDEVKDEYRAEVSAIKMFPAEAMKNGVPGLESVLAEEPDLVVGTAYAFNSNNVGDIQDFIGNGINIYASEGTYVEKPTLENVYNDIENLGKIFGVSDRAETLISSLRSREKKITDMMKATDEIAVSCTRSPAAHR